LQRNWRECLHVHFQAGGGGGKAVDGGPWVFDKDLLVMEEFVPENLTEEYTFTHIPILVCVFRLPLGKMDRNTAELIGDQICEFLHVDSIEDGLAVGNTSE
jgi:hypothetical protein